MDIEKMKEAQKLEKYPGIGKIRARLLIDHFGSYGKTQSAGIDELMILLGERTGQRVYNMFHNIEDEDLSNIDYGRKSDYTTELGKSIAEKYSKGADSIKDIMKHFGFSEQTFYTWKDGNLEFFELIKSAGEMRRTRKSELADRGLEKLLTGYEVNEQTTVAQPVMREDGTRENIIRETRVTKRHIPPNATMIIFTKCNTDPDNYKHIQHIKHDTGNVIAPYDFSRFTDEELILFESLSKKAMNGSEE